MWSEEEQGQLLLAGTKIMNDGGDTTARWIAIATRAVELVAARGGTMTAEALDLAMGSLMLCDRQGEAALIRAHAIAQGARVAVLEDEVRGLLGERQRNEDIVKENLGLSANLTIACRKADEQRERADGLGRELSEVSADYTRAFGNAKEYLARWDAAESRLQRMRDGISDMVKRCVEMARVVDEPPASTCDCAAKNIACIHWARRAFHHYPCSSTCTHDDAATPGHPERVRERSEGFTSAASLANGYVRASDTAALFGAQGPDGHPLSMARREGFNEGAEATRAACWEAVQERLRAMGIVDPSVFSGLKAAIEGAAP